MKLRTYSLPLGFLFLLSTFFIVPHAHADVLLPGNINSCGELAVEGIYTLTQDISVGSSTPCFTITAESVVIEVGSFELSGQLLFQGASWAGDDSLWDGERTWAFDSYTFNYGTVTGDTSFSTISANQGTVEGNAFFFDGSSNEGTVEGNASFYSDSFHSSGTITGTATFNDSTINQGDLYANAVFNDTSYNAATIYGDVTFNGSSYSDYGSITGNVTLNDSSRTYETSIDGNATFNDASFGEYGTINGNATFNTTYYNNGSNSAVGGVFTFSGSVVFSGSYGGTIYGSDNAPITSYVFTNGATNESNIDSSAITYVFTDYTNYDAITGNATFNGSSVNNGTINGSATFNGSSVNNGEIYGDSTTFNDTSIHAGITQSNATFNDYSYSNGSIDGNATFNDYSYNENGEIYGNAIFNDYSYNGGSSNVYGNATFNDSSYNGEYGYVQNNATFRNQSGIQQLGYISGNAYVYHPSSRPLGSQVDGLTYYYDYPGLYFNDKDTNDGDWNNTLNWWQDDDFTIPLGALPSPDDEIYIASDLTVNTGSTAIADTAIFINGATNNIRLTVTTSATFRGSSRNEGAIIGGTTTFEDNLSENEGTVNELDSTLGTPQESNRNWRSITSSADGSKLAAIVLGGQIYTSTDSGATWTPRDSTRQWRSITSSADGTKLAAVVAGGRIYTSSDSGATWTQRESNRAWLSITSSSDGTKLAAVAINSQIYTSTDSGATWIPRDSSRGWVSITSSADGTKLAAVTEGGSGLIFTSTDSGATWTQRASGAWRSITSSSDGTKLAAVGDGRIFTSTNSGVSWTPRESSRSWFYITSSADGTKLAAVVNGGQIYTSSDSGATWTQRESNRAWLSITSSSDGTKLAAAVFGGQIYTFDLNATDDNSGPLYRRFTESIATMRNFLTEGDRNDWIIEAYNAVVDLTDAIYSSLTNIFRAFNNAIFIPNPSINGGADVVPQIEINAPLSGTSTIKWKPDVFFDDATVCEYRFGGDDYETIDCVNEGSDIPRPDAGSGILYVKGTDDDGNLSERSVSFTYDNTSPYGITEEDCSLPLDEDTRSYYFLEEDVSCTLEVEVSTELRGNGFEAAGIEIASSANLSLINASILGSVSYANGADDATLTITSSTVLGDINVNQASSASSAGTLRITSSTVADVFANGRTTTGNGGAGGHIYATSTIFQNIEANGGSSTSCGNGGDSGQVALFDSTYASLSNIAGAASTVGCPGQTRTGGTVRPPQISTTPPPSPTPSPSSPSTPSGSNTAVRLATIQGTPVPAAAPTQGQGALPSFSLPVVLLSPLALPAIPSFGSASSSFTFVPRIASFLASTPFPLLVEAQLEKSPALRGYLASKGVVDGRTLSALIASPLSSIEDAPAAFTFRDASGAPLPSVLTLGGWNDLVQKANVLPGAIFQVTLQGGAKEGSWNGTPAFFDASGTISLKAPNASGTYVLTSPSSPLPLLIQVKAEASYAKPSGFFMRVWNWLVGR